MLRVFIAAALIAGCADDDAPVIPENPNDDEIVPEGQIRAGTLCEVPSGGAACALACEPDALIEQHVPKGTCILFECVASDGTRFRVGGCNL